MKTSTSILIGKFMPSGNKEYNDEQRWTGRNIVLEGNSFINNGKLAYMVSSFWVKKLIETNQEIPKFGNVNASDVKFLSFIK